MSEKVLKHFTVKFEFQTSIPKQCWLFSLYDCTDHSTYMILNFRKLMQDGNKIEVKYQKAPFSESVSTTFVAHCGMTCYYQDIGIFNYWPESCFISGWERRSLSLDIEFCNLGSINRRAFKWTIEYYKWQIILSWNQCLVKEEDVFGRRGWGRTHILNTFAILQKYIHFTLNTS